MPSSIARLTALDHDRMVRLLRRASRPGPSQQRWRDEVVHLVLAHLDAERETLTPDVLAVLPDVRPPGGPEDQALADLARRMADEPFDSAAYSGLCMELEQTLTRHAASLDEALRRLEAQIPRKQVRQLGGAYAERRDHALREQGDGEPPPRRLDLSRAELYELARKAGIEGRSSMSRRDLIAELQRRQRVG